MIGLVIPHYGILSDQVDSNRLVNMLVKYQKVLRLDYFDFVSENFSLVRTGSDKNYPETVFSNLEILFIVFLHIATTNSPCSMWNISDISKIHFPVCCPAWRHTRNMHTGGPKQLCRLTVTVREWRGRSWHRVDRGDKKNVLERTCRWLCLLRSLQTLVVQP